jgi:hypothetical protein
VKKLKIKRIQGHKINSPLSLGFLSLTHPARRASHMCYLVKKNRERI